MVGRLAGTHRVFALDQRGHGHSDWPGEYGFARWRDDVIGFLQALGLERVALIGHSLGALAALLVAAERRTWWTGWSSKKSPAAARRPAAGGAGAAGRPAAVRLAGRPRGGGGAQRTRPRVVGRAGEGHRTDPGHRRRCDQRHPAGTPRRAGRAAPRCPPGDGGGRRPARPRGAPRRVPRRRQLLPHPAPVACGAAPALRGPQLSGSLGPVAALPTARRADGGSLTAGPGLVAVRPPRHPPPGGLRFERGRPCS
ncbi:alpha/beta fold hydrolase [Streptomyces lydicamycinicus]|uniref:alpha/beta fold hydrolase n=1 Tax=Streptomyces lydicamycinicus TaxID=1546107 RepID=UPI003D8034A9